MIKQAVILAGGKGTRLGNASDGLPKALVLIDGESVISRQLDLCKRHGIERALVLVGHGGGVVRENLGDECHGIRVEYVQEEEPLGTAGALRAAHSRLDEVFFVLYADTVLNVDLTRFAAFHARVGAEITLMVHPNGHPTDSDIVEYGDDRRVVAIHAYPHPEGKCLASKANAALYLIQRAALAGAHFGRQDLAKDLVPRLLAAGCRIFAYPSREYIKDMGTPARLAQVRADTVEGKVARGSLDTPQPAIFFDRDGTLTSRLGYVRRPEELELFEGAAGAINMAHGGGFLTVLATNQPVLARGEVTPDEFVAIQNKLAWELGKQGAYLDAAYFCPHHPDGGFAGEVPALKRVCGCRKPAIGMVTAARDELGLDLARSWMIGDATVDIAMAAAAGLRSVLVRTGLGGLDRKYTDTPDFETFDVAEGVMLITDGYKHLRDHAKALVAEMGRPEVVLMAGLARSGKTSFASALRLELEESGRTATVIELDGWVRPMAERGPTIREGYDIPAFLKFLGRFRAAPLGQQVLVPLYDRPSRAPVKEARRLVRSEVLIIEGVPALLHSELLAVSETRVFVVTNEVTRRARFAREYRLRGFNDPDTAALFEKRERDEHPQIRVSREHARFTVELGP